MVLKCINMANLLSYKRTVRLEKAICSCKGSPGRQDICFLFSYITCYVLTSFSPDTVSSKYTDNICEF